MENTENKLFKKKKYKIDWERSFDNFADNHPGYAGVFMAILMGLLATAMAFMPKYGWFILIGIVVIVFLIRGIKAFIKDIVKHEQ